MGLQPTGKTPDQRAAEKRKVKRSGIRPIDKGTPYDVQGRMMQLSRRIAAGDFGEVSDVICIVRGKKNASIHSQAFFYGTSDTPTLHYMCLRAATRCME